MTIADAIGPSTNSSARESTPPTRLSSTRAAATTTAGVCTSTSRVRMWATSCASTPSSSSNGSACSRPVLTPIADPTDPRPAANARGNPSRMM